MVLELYSWGANSHGQLGLGFESEMCETPQRVQDVSVDLKTIEKIQGGGGHLLILDKTGLVYGCGWNTKGQLGLCNTNDSLLIKPLPKTDTPIADIACGWDSSAAIDQNGNLYVWGSNAFDQLGFSSQFIDKLFTFPILLNLPLNEKAKQVCFGLRYMCILCESKNVYIVGRWRFQDQCKTIMHNDTQFHQIVIPSNFEVKRISSGSNHIICECVDNSSVVILGFGDNKLSQCTKQLIEYGIRHIRSGWSHNGFLANNGSVFLWGRNTYGQLANSEVEKSDGLVKLQGISENVEQFHLGSEHRLVVTEKSSVFTWGWNEHGNCGNGTDINLVDPSQVQLPGKCVLATTGAGFCYALVDIE